MTAIFISYRRALNIKDAQLLQSQLERDFGSKGVFLDVIGVEGGDHWLHTLERQVDVSAAMVVLIGPDWTSAKDALGNRRLDAPDDFVRFEIARAFLRRIPVLPVLVDGARMPDTAELPQNLLPLQFQQGMIFRADAAKGDAKQIASRLRQLIQATRPRSGLPVWAAGAAAAVALSAGITTGPWLLANIGLPVLGVNPSTIEAIRKLEEEVVLERKRRSEAEKSTERLRDELKTLDGNRLREIKELHAALDAAGRGETVAALPEKTPLHPETSIAVASTDGWKNIYTVQQGDSMYKIARKYGVLVADLLKANGIASPSELKLGMTLRVPSEGKTVASTTPARVIVIPQARTPDRRVAALTDNQVGSSDASPPSTQAAAISLPPSPSVAVSAKLQWPVQGALLAGFGQRSDGTHNDGLNIAVPQGSAVHAAQDGEVAYAGSELEGYGNLILLRHDQGWVTAYAHNSELLVQRGDKVKRGDIIAKSGRTGDADKPQLHFELRIGSKPVDPLPHLDTAEVKDLNVNRKLKKMD